MEARGTWSITAETRPHWLCRGGRHRLGRGEGDEDAQQKPEGGDTQSRVESIAERRSVAASQGKHSPRPRLPDWERALHGQPSRLKPSSPRAQRAGAARALHPARQGPLPVARCCPLPSALLPPGQRPVPPRLHSPVTAPKAAPMTVLPQSRICAACCSLLSVRCSLLALCLLYALRSLLF